MSVIADACRLCETSDINNLRYIFNKDEVHHENLAQIIFVMTDVKVDPTDVVSQKICARCCNIVQKMYKYRQDAQKQDKALKEKCSQLLTKGLKLPNTITIKQKSERISASKSEALASEEKGNRSLAKPKKDKSVEQAKSKRGKSEVHPSITTIFQQYPTLKIQKKVFSSNFIPTVSLKMGEVERYFKRKKLDMKNFIWQPQTARKKTSSEVAESTKTVAPIKICKRVLEKHDANLAAEKDISSDESMRGRKRRRATSEDTSVSNSTNISYASTSDHSKDLNKLREVRETTPVQDSNKTESSTPGTPGSLLMVSKETRSQPIFVCDLCGSVHNSNGMLKNHLAKKHMVCQFCKKRFKSLDAKNDHIESDCTIKQMMNSNFPIVTLERIEKDVQIRLEYSSAFNGWDPLPGSENVARLSSAPPVQADIPKFAPEPAKDDGIIVLSDDDEPQNSIDQLPTARVSENKVDHTAITVSSVKPDVRIKNNSVLGNLSQNATDLQVIKELLGVVLPKPQLNNLSTQTDVPGNHDIKVNLSDGTATLRNLKEQLKVFKVPLTIKYGNFSACYKSTVEEKHAPFFHYWEHIPIEDVAVKPTGANKPAKNFFAPQNISTASPSLNRMNGKHNPNISGGSSSITSVEAPVVSAPPTPPSEINLPAPPSKINLPANILSKPNHHSVSVSNNLTPHLSIPKPSVNYSPSGTVDAASNSPIILNHKLNTFSSGSASNISSRPVTAVNLTPAAALGSSSQVINPVSVNNGMMNYSCTVSTPMIRVKSVKELQ